MPSVGIGSVLLDFTCREHTVNKLHALGPYDSSVHSDEMTGGLVPQDIEARYEVHQWRHGLPILAAARPTEWADSWKCCAIFGCSNRKSSSPAEASRSSRAGLTAISRSLDGRKSVS